MPPHVFLYQIWSVMVKPCGRRRGPKFVGLGPRSLLDGIVADCVSFTVYVFIFHLGCHKTVWALDVLFAVCTCRVYVDGLKEPINRCYDK